MCAGSGTCPRRCSWYPVQRAQVSHLLTAGNRPPFCTSTLPLLFRRNVMFLCCCFCSDPHTISGLSLVLPFFTEGVRTLQEICTSLYFLFWPFTCSVLLYKGLYFTFHIQYPNGRRNQVHKAQWSMLWCCKHIVGAQKYLIRKGGREESMQHFNLKYPKQLSTPGCCKSTRHYRQSFGDLESF